ncbi:MAG TPA: hypothetical protein PKE04_21935, partial [Clostridia bacterium]|nr:hypothetical protein [Clostridia bacterium]
MDARLKDVLTGAEDNYMMPFLWLHAGEHDRILSQIAAVRESGARAFCVESRPHEHFGEDEWWKDMDLVLSEASRLGMRVWILDDKHYPTGYCNGLIERKYPNRRKWHLVEDHIDVIGPMRGSMLIARPQENWGLHAAGTDEADSLVGVYAYKRLPFREDMVGPAIDLSLNIQDGFLVWDVPEGVWRVFFLYKSRRGASGRSAISMHMIDHESVSTLIEAVYEPHFQHYARYFGNTLAGFFSDEPSFGNELVNWRGPRGTMYDNNIGTRGLALPWSEELLERMSAQLGQDAKPMLPALWYPLDDGCPDV